jgi:pyocin large subunit-like protein
MPKMNVSQVITNYYEKWTLSEMGKTNPNEPKTNPKQTQNEPNPLLVTKSTQLALTERVMKINNLAAPAKTMV